MILVAPDSFKGTFDAVEVAAAIGRGVQRAGQRADLCPAADGGEGTVAAVQDWLGAEPIETVVADPLGRPTPASFGLCRERRIAIVEMAAASGLARIPERERDPWTASTRGSGELIVAASTHGAREIVIGMGGSATTDGGIGALSAIEAAGGLHGVALTVLCDVRTPYEQAATIFGPQKGADDAMVRRLSARLHEAALGFRRDPRGVPMTGCAGGLSGALWAELDASLVPGAEWILDALAFDSRAAGAAAVVTGEGRLDAQTGAGKLVGAIAARGGRRGVPVHAIVGSSAVSAAVARQLGLASVTEASTLAQIEAAGEALAARLEPSRNRPSP